MNSTQKSTRPRAAAAAIALLSIAAASASLPAHADTGKTPYQIKGKASGLCVTGVFNEVAMRTSYELQPCNDAAVTQKFYLLDSNAEQEIIPQTMNVGYGARIVDAGHYDMTWAPWEWRPLMAEASWGGQAFTTQASTQYPDPQGTWNLWRTQPSTSYTKNQMLIANGATINNGATIVCLSTENHRTTPGTKVVVGECNTPLDVWNLVTTTFPWPTVRATTP